MSFAKDLADVLEELNYPTIKNVNFDNLSLSDFSQIANWISKQIHFFAKTDSVVHVIKDDKDLVSLNIELNSLFKEVDSIYSDSFSLDNVNDRLSILHSLSGDLLAARLDYIRNQNDDDFTTELNPRKDLSTINTCLSICDDHKDSKLYFQKVKETLDKHLLKFHEEDSLLLPDKKNLTSEQWAELKRLNETFRSEYSIRREMLLRRADTTINSFTWKDDPTREDNPAQLKNVFNKIREKMSVAPCITLSNALSARSSDCNSLINDVISTTHASCLIETPNITNKANQGAQQLLQLHKFLIGAVPDRGGRPGEQPAPVKESFTQQQNQRENANNRRGGGGGGRQRDNYRNDRGTNYNQRNIPDQTNRLQNAGWQADGGGGQNYQGGRGQNYQQYDDYNQYQGGHQRFTGNQNQNNDQYENYNNRGRGGRGRGQNRNNR